MVEGLRFCVVIFASMSWPARSTSGQIRIAIRSAHFDMKRTLAQSMFRWQPDSRAPVRLTSRAGVVHAASLYLGVANEPGIGVGNCDSDAGRHSERKLRRSHEEDV